MPEEKDGEPGTSSRLRLQDRIVELQEKLDALTKLKGLGVLPPGTKAAGAD